MNKLFIISVTSAAIFAAGCVNENEVKQGRSTSAAGHTGITQPEIKNQTTSLESYIETDLLLSWYFF